ncbi:MAG: ATP-dependent Clp protease adapter ClpS [Verrucomicrobia bacterium]|nr:ATP-dependent Clp protease adapter ClpS [Verrucomicrobiota bacterium]
MPETETPVLVPEKEMLPESKTKEGLAPVYRVIVWNDPVNLMQYVTHVFQKVFGWDRQKAETHMLEVHHRGKSVVAREGQEKAEHYVHQLQSYSLHATMEPEESP